MTPPEKLTVADSGGQLANAAETDLAASIVTMQAPVPVHAPPQLVRVELPEPVAVNVTRVPDS